MSMTARIAKALASMVSLDPSQFKCDYKIETWTVSTLLDYLNRGILVISEELQRQYVWDEVTASKFIESLMARLPVPPIMVYQYDNVYYVLDGVQRITTVKKFFENKLTLTGVMWRELRNKRYKDLREKYQHMFLTATVPVQIVKVDASREVQVQVYLEIFRRVNLGARRLKFTDILFCSIPTPAIQLVKDVARSDEFTKLFSPTPEEIRDMKHYFLSLALHLSIEREAPLNLSASYKQRYLSDIWNFVFNSDIEHLQDISRQVRAVVRLGLELGLSRDWFTPKYYGIYIRQQRSILSVVLAQVILLALRAVAKPVEENGILHYKIDADPTVIHQTILDTIRNFKADGKTIREVYHDITKSGKTRYLEMLYNNLVEALKLAIS